MMQQYLSEAELESFSRDGFVVVRNMYSANEMAQLSDWIDELCAMPLVRGKQMVYLEDSLKQPGTEILSRIEYFVDFHAGLRDFVLGDKMLRRCAELLGDESVLFKEKINFKLPGGAGFEPHQDIQPGWDDYCPYFISVLVTVDESTPANGCLELAAGHHTRGLLGERWKALTPEELSGVEFVQYPMKPGDVAFFDCFVPHQSKLNLTEKQRRNMYLTYNRRSDGDHRQKYFSDKRASYPPNNERNPGETYKFRV